jgi:hypothetical protein
MSYRILSMATALIAATTFASTAEAQTSRMHIGPRVSYQFDLEKIGLGAQFSIPVLRQLEFYPSLDYFFVDPGSFWSFNADLKFRVAAESLHWLYLGAGLNVARSAAGGVSNTRAGFNAFVGAESLRGRIHPFGEFRFTARDGSTGQLAAGVNFTL